ncbi:hypothetical protein ABFX02_13G083400 [Erythranthe guttata]
MTYGYISLFLSFLFFSLLLYLCFMYVDILCNDICWLCILMVLFSQVKLHVCYVYLYSQFYFHTLIWAIVSFSSSFFQLFISSRVDILENANGDSIQKSTLISAVCFWVYFFTTSLKCALKHVFL